MFSFFLFFNKTGETTTEPSTSASEDDTLSPYSSHKRKNQQRRLTPLKPIFDSQDIQIIDLEDAKMDELMDEMDEPTADNEHDDGNSGLARTRDTSSITEESNFEEVATAADDEESDIESIYDNVTKEDINGNDDDFDNEDRSREGHRIFLRGSSGDGFLIRKKLRQKGISIVVGSSSSEGMISKFAFLCFFYNFPMICLYYRTTLNFDFFIRLWFIRISLLFSYMYRLVTKDRFPPGDSW